LLPSQIQYVRVPIDSAVNELVFYTEPKDGKTANPMKLTLKENEPFKFIQTLDYTGFKH
jgi:hypothetical protein